MMTTVFLLMILSCLLIAEGADGVNLVVAAHLFQTIFALRLKFFELMQAQLNVLQLLLEHQLALFNFFYDPAQLRQFADRRVVQFEHFADFIQRKTKALAAQNQFQTGVITLAVQAVTPLSLGIQQSLTFIKADGASGNVEFLGQLGNGISPVSIFVRISVSETEASRSPRTLRNTSS
jgi:hypothetical protein